MAVLQCSNEKIQGSQSFNSGVLFYVKVRVEIIKIYYLNTKYIRFE